MGSRPAEWQDIRPAVPFFRLFSCKKGDGVVTLQHENMLDMDELFFTNSCQHRMADVEKEAYEQVYGALPVMVRLPK